MILYTDLKSGDAMAKYQSAPRFICFEGACSEINELGASPNISHEYYLYHMKMCKNYKNYIFVANV